MYLNPVPLAKLEEIAKKVMSSQIKIPESVEEIKSFLKENRLFDSEYYIVANQEEGIGIEDALNHYVSNGWKEGRNPNLWFDCAFYRKMNPDVDTQSNHFLHYLFQGYVEGRQPNKSYIQRRGRLIVCPILDTYDVGKIQQSLQSLLNQIKSPDRIIIQLPRERFLNGQTCLNFIDVLDKGVEVHWCDDLGAYSSLLTTVMEYPDDMVVGCSLRHVWRPDLLQNLYAAYASNPGNVVCCRAAGVSFGEDEVGFDFLTNGTGGSSFYNLPYSELGILIPPKAWKSITFDRNIFQRHAPKFPALWYWLMSVLNDHPIRELNSYNCILGNIEAVITGISNKYLDDENEFRREADSLLYYFKDELQKKLNFDFYKQILRKRVIKGFEKWSKKSFDLNVCKGFNEKIQYLKINDDNPIKSPLSDKFHAREYIRSKIGGDYFVKILGVWPSFDDIDFSKLPNQFVLKTTHGSGSIILVNNKSLLNMREAREKFIQWQKDNFALVAGEMNYFHITPMIIAEEFLGGAIEDYKCICKMGKVKYIWVDVDRYNRHRRNLYSPQWEMQNFEVTYQNSAKFIPKPKYLDEMIRLAEKLTEPFLHARADFFVVADQLKIGEITFYSEAGYSDFFPQEAAVKFGEVIDLGRNDLLYRHP